MRARPGNARADGRVAVVYRIIDAGRWGEPRQTLDDDKKYPTVDLNLIEPKIEVTFETSAGKDCGTASFNLVRTPVGKWVPDLPYLISNTNLPDILHTVTSCAAR